AMCRQYGVAICRGNEMNWLHTPKSAFKESFIRRGLRAADSWLNLTGHNCHPYPVDQARGAMNIPSSRFLRPWNKHLRAFENLRLARITKAMRHAARTGTVYHLWWHPHNFGANLEENMIFLGRILAFFDQLREEYGMASMTMGDIADRSKRNGRRTQRIDCPRRREHLGLVQCPLPNICCRSALGSTAFHRAFGTLPHTPSWPLARGWAIALPSLGACANGPHQP